MTFRRTLLRVVLPAALVIGSIALGTVGFRDYHRSLAAHEADAPATGMQEWVDAFYHAVGLPILQTVAIRPGAVRIPPRLEVARLLGVLAFTYAIAAAIIAFAWHRVAIPLWVLAHRLGLGGHPGHAVVCGLGWKGRQLVGDLKRLGYWVAVVERDEANGFLPWCINNGVKVVRGDASEPAVLREAGVGHCARVYVVCNNDDVALQTARAVAANVGRTRRHHNVECAVGFDAANMPMLLPHIVAAETDDGRQYPKRLRCRAFLTDDSTARLFLARYPLDAPKHPGGRTHLHLCGNSALNRALLTRALRVCHFGNALRLAPHLHCSHAEEALHAFCERHTFYRPIRENGVLEARPISPWDIETVPPVAFHELSAAVPVLLADDSPMFRVAAGEKLQVVAAIDDGPQSAWLIATLAPKLGRVAAGSGFDAQACYYFNSPDMQYRRALEGSLDRSIPGVGIRSFTDFLDGCHVAAVDGGPLDDLARLLNFHYLAPDLYLTLRGTAALEQANKQWVDATSEEDREYSRSAADHLAVKVRFLGLSWEDLLNVGRSRNALQLSELDILLEQRIKEHRSALGRIEHRRWSADHLLNGYMAGKQKLKAERTHPCLVPFEELPCVVDERTQGNPMFYQEQACRMASVIPRLVADLREIRGMQS